MSKSEDNQEEKIMEYCNSCGRAYEIVYDVPDEIWNKITLKKGDGFLCIACANKRAEDLGIDLYWSANKGEYLSVEMERLKKIEIDYNQFIIKVEHTMISKDVELERLKKENEWLTIEYTMYWFRHGGYPHLETKQIRENILDHMQKALNGSNKNGSDD